MNSNVVNPKVVLKPFLGLDHIDPHLVKGLDSAHYITRKLIYDE